MIVVLVTQGLNKFIQCSSDLSLFYLDTLKAYTKQL